MWEDSTLEDNLTDWCAWRANQLCDADPDLSWERAKELAMSEYDAGVAW